MNKCHHEKNRSSGSREPWGCSLGWGGKDCLHSGNSECRGPQSAEQQQGGPPARVVGGKGRQRDVKCGDSLGQSMLDLVGPEKALHCILSVMGILDGFCPGH